MYDYSRRRSNYSPLVLGAFSFLIVVAALQMLRGVPEPAVSITLPESSPIGEARQPSLPEQGSAIVAVDGLGILAEAGPAQPQPIASVTKIMTAYVILKSHPLQPGQSGPPIELTAADEQRWVQMIAEDQSSLPVTAGQRLTQLQLLQGLLVPSANNYGEILAKWDAGSVAAFVEKMNAEARALGMTSTRYGDTSGFSPGSTSTPVDQLILARAAMQDPVFASIVQLEQVTIPGIGLTFATNNMLGVDGVVGIKTGFTEEAGVNISFAARRDAGGRPVEVFGVVLGQEDRLAMIRATRDLLASLDGGIESKRVLAAGQPVATVETRWGARVDLVLGEDLELLVWPGLNLTATVEIEDVSAPMRAGEQAGWLNVVLGEQARRLPLVLSEGLDGPGIFWRLTRF